MILLLEEGNKSDNLSASIIKSGCKDFGGASQIKENSVWPFIVKYNKALVYL